MGSEVAGADTNEQQANDDDDDDDDDDNDDDDNDMDFYSAGSHSGCGHTALYNLYSDTKRSESTTIIMIIMIMIIIIIIISTIMDTFCMALLFIRNELTAFYTFTQ